MKKLLFIFLLLISAASYGQGNWTLSGARNRWANGIGLGLKDSASYANGSDTNILSVTTGGRLMFKHTTYWNLFATSADLNLYVLYTDTASMLSGYYNKGVSNGRYVYKTIADTITATKTFQTGTVAYRLFDGTYKTDVYSETDTYAQGAEMHRNNSEPILAGHHYPSFIWQNTQPTGSSRFQFRNSHNTPLVDFGTDNDKLSSGQYRMAFQIGSMPDTLVQLAFINHHIASPNVFLTMDTVISMYSLSTVTPLAKMDLINNRFIWGDTTSNNNYLFQIHGAANVNTNLVVGGNAQLGSEIFTSRGNQNSAMTAATLSNQSSGANARTDLTFQNGAGNNLNITLTSAANATPNRGTVNSVSGDLALASNNTNALILNTDQTATFASSLSTTAVTSSGVVSATKFNSSLLTGSRALVSSSGKDIVSSAVTSTELNRLSGLTSNIIQASDTSGMLTPYLRPSGTLTTGYLLQSNGGRNVVPSSNGNINSNISFDTDGLFTVNTLTANTAINGRLNTAAQPNITSVGTLTSLAIGGVFTSTNYAVINSSATNTPTLFGRTSKSAMGTNAAGGIQIKNEVSSTGSLAGLFFEDRAGSVTSSTNWYGWYASSGTVFMYNGSSNIASINGTTGAYTALSDSTLKKNIKPSSSALSTLLKIPVDSYTWKANGEFEPWGIVAQKLYPIAPSYSIKPNDSKSKWGVAKAEMIPMVIKSVQEQQAQINSLKAQNDNLQSQIDELKAILKRNNIK